MLEELKAHRSAHAVRRFVVRARGRVHFVQADEVEWIEAEGNYVSLHVGKQSHMIRGTMRRLEEVLDPSRFARVHRSAIVNLDRIREVQPWFNGDFVIITESGHEVATGETYRPRLQELLKNPL